MSLVALNDCPGSDGLLSSFLRIPGNAENVRERYFRDARRIGLSESDADDGAQAAMLLLCRASDYLDNGERFAPSRAFYSIRRYMRRSLYRGFTGERRARKTKMVALCDIEARTRTANARGERFPDNPAAIVAAIETAAGRLAKACGRDAKAIRGMTQEDVRALVMPDTRGLAEREPGECPRVVESLPGASKPSMEPRPAMPGDGTEWRACGLEWAEVSPVADDGQPREWWESATAASSQARHFLRLNG